MKRAGGWKFAGAVAAITALAAAGCGGSSGSSGGSGSSNASKGSQTVKVGFFAPESGFAAADGASAYDAAKLAVSQAGASGGPKIQLVNYDDGSDVKQAVSIATKLVTQDHVAAVVSGSYSDQTLAAASIYQRSRVPMLAAYAVNPGIPAAGDSIFQQDYSGKVEGAAGAQALVEQMHAKHIAIVSVDNDFGHALVDGFKAQAAKLGATVVATDFNQFGEKQFTPVIQSDLGKGADGFYMVQYAAEGKQFVQDWNALKVHKPLLGTEGIDSTTQFIQPVGAAANGMVFTTSLNRDATDPTAKKFLQDFTARYGHPPDMVAATTYDSFLVLENALKKGTSADSIRSAVAATKNFAGATGTLIRYTPQRSAVRAVDLEVFKGGKVHNYGSISDPSVITP